MAKYGAKIHQHIAKYELEGFRRYATLLERLLTEEADEFNSSLSKAMGGSIRKGAMSTSTIKWTSTSR